MEEKTKTKQNNGSSSKLLNRPRNAPAWRGKYKTVVRGCPVPTLSSSLSWVAPVPDRPHMPCVLSASGGPGQLFLWMSCLVFISHRCRVLRSAHSHVVTWPSSFCVLRHCCHICHRLHWRRWVPLVPPQELVGRAGRNQEWKRKGGN